MAIAYRSSSAAPTPTDGTGSPLAVPVPTGAAVDDIAVLALEVNGTTDPTITWPSGFTQKINVSNTDLKLKVAWKRLTAADTGNYSISYTSSGEFRQAQCILISGAVATGDPFETTNTAQADGTTTIPSVSVTTTVQPLLIHYSSILNFRTSTAPTSYTRVQDANYLDTSYFIPGTTGTHTATGGTVATSTDHISALLAVMPAAAGSNVVGTAALDVAMSFTVVGQKLVPATAAMSVNVTGVVNGINDRVGSAATNITFTATALGAGAGVTVNGLATANFTTTGVVAGTRTATGTASPGIGFTATVNGLRATFGSTSAAISITATATDGDFSMNQWDGLGLQHHMNRLAGTLVNNIPSRDAQGAANVWAATTNKDLLEALNIKAGNTLPNYKDLAGVLNQLAGTTGLEVDGAAAMIP